MASNVTGALEGLSTATRADGGSFAALLDTGPVGTVVIACPTVYTAVERAKALQVLSRSDETGKRV